MLLERCDLSLDFPGLISASGRIKASIRTKTSNTTDATIVTITDTGDAITQAQGPCPRAERTRSK
jgi:hypothetical protein